jgi:tetratricopeptide (TPR) repeat protein
MDAKDIVVIGLSSSALIVSITSFVLTFRQRVLENIRGVRKSLTDVISDLGDVALARAKLDADNPTVTEQITRLRRLYNSQRRYLANHAEYLAAQIPALVSDIDYSVLAVAFDAIGDYDRAQKHWENCVSASPSAPLLAMNLRGFARFLFFQGNAQLGRKKYHESLEVELPDTDNIRQIRADTYAMWAKTEMDFGYEQEARRLKEQAISTAKRIAHKGMRAEFLVSARMLFVEEPPTSKLEKGPGDA